MTSKTVFVFVALAISAALAYKTGGPKEACGDMTPQHYADAQKTKAPYIVSVSTKNVKGGDKVIVTIKGKSSSETIKGFMIQAHGKNSRIGQFQVDPRDKNVKGVACDESQDRSGRKVKINSAVTHQNNDEKDTVTATWIAPKGVDDVVSFHTTIVQSGHVFWVDVNSDQVKVSQ